LLCGRPGKTWLQSNLYAGSYLRAAIAVAYVKGNTMTTFDQARAKAAAAAGRPAAEYGWENDDVYLIGFDYGDERPPFDEPDVLIDKRTGELRAVYGMLGHAPAPNLRPIGSPPD
jgi:hypothetical protein